MKTGILSFIALLFVGSACAQGFYLNVEGGYGWGLPSSNLGTEIFMDDLTANNTNFYEKNVYGSMGSGINVKLTPGYMFNKYIGVELGINYFIGAKTVLEKTTSTDPEYLSSKTIHSNQLRILPTVVFNTGGDGLYGYGKLGLVLPVMGAVHAVQDLRNPNSPTPASQVDLLRVKATVKGSPSLGFYGELGIGYHITDLIGVHLGVFHTSLSIKPKTMKIDSYNKNGVEEIDNLTTYASQVNYVDEINASSNNSDYGPQSKALYSKDINKPKDELAHKSNFNQVGVMIGISFNF